jgi:hypothetical protein
MIATASIVTEPDFLSPVHAEIFYITNSASASAFNNYKYVYDVYEVNLLFDTIRTKLGTYKVPPRPINYNGVISVNKILKNQISNRIGFEQVKATITNVTQNQDLCIKYNIDYGFQYNPNLPYLDFVNSPDFGIVFQNNPGLTAGDLIVIDKTNKLVNSQYDGLHEVLDVSGGTISISGFTFGVYFAELDGSFGEPTPTFTDAGFVVDILRMQDSTTPLYGYYGTRQYEQVNFDFTNDYLIATISSTQSYSFLTNYQGYKPIKKNEFETVDFMYNANDLLNDYTQRLTTYDSSNTIISTYDAAATFSSPFKYFTMPTGTENLLTTYSDLTLFDNVHFYKIELVKSGNVITQPILRKIDFSCTPYENIRLVFLNRMGGYDYWTFDRDLKRNVSISRSEYKKVLEPFYNIGDRGYTTIHQDVQYTYTLNSNWISEYDYAYLEELITSPDVYILNSDGTLTPINITDTSYSIKTQFREQLFNMVINYKLSNNINVPNA